MRFPALCPASRRLCAVLLLLLSMPTLVHAGAGLSLSGYGAQSAGMAGVDIAIVADTTALQHNPAGLAHLQGPALDVYLEPYYALGNAHDDRYGPKQLIENRPGAVFGVGYARPFADGDVIAGIGLYAQGGTGWVYDDLPTRYGGRDDAMTLFGIFKLAPGIAWRVSDQLRLGAGLGIAYGTARQKLFPRTSVYDPQAPTDPAKTFFGTRYDSGEALGVGGKLGMQYEPNERWTLALTWQSEIPLDIENGVLTVNYDAIGLGRVRYRQAEQTGLAFASEIGFGATWQVLPRWTLAGEFIWMDQSTGLRGVTLRASRPDHPQAPDIEATQRLKTDDQYVIGLAFEHQLDAQSVLRGGYTHSRTPIERSALSPLLALVLQDLVGVGYARQWSPQWGFAVSAEYQIPTSRRYSNPDLPFGENAREYNEALLLTLQLSRRW